MATPRSSSSVASTARHVEQIVQAAERTAEELRSAAEARANERIAEAERAAELRVRAADEEAAEVRRAAAAQARETLAEAEAAAQAALAEAQEAAREAEDKAGKRARELIYEARAATRDVLRDGETLSGHLHQLSDSLRANAERLLLDIRAAHAEMTARLDRVDPDLGAPVGRLDRSLPPAAPAAEPDIPEFIPRRPR
jgi:hypothetical protein